MPRWADGEEGLREMCDYGAREVRAGRAEGLRLDCFNEDESDFVKQYMAERHPDVPFGTTYYDFGKKEQSDAQS